MITTILVFAGTLLILVGVHEGGHFLAAKLTGVYVKEFAIGFGPKIASFSGPETRYSIRIIPFGGYVLLAGEDRQETSDEIPRDRLLYNKHPLVRILISLAGPASNLLTTLVIILLVLWSFGTPMLQVAEVMNGMPTSGVLQPGDLVLSLDGRPVFTLDALSRIVQSTNGEPVEFRIRRDGATLAYAVTPRFVPDEHRYVVGAYFLSTTYTNVLTDIDPKSILAIAGLEVNDRVVAAGGVTVTTGVGFVNRLDELLPRDSVPITVERGGAQVDLSVSSAGLDVIQLLDGVTFGNTGLIYGRPGLFSGLTLGAGQFSSYLQAMVSALHDVITRRVAASKAIAGPVGIANLLGEGFREGPSAFLQIFSFLSLSLGLFNLIPFPALDGSRAAFALYEIVRRKTIPPEREGMIHLIGFFILIAVMLLITYQDILALFR